MTRLQAVDKLPKDAQRFISTFSSLCPSNDIDVNDPLKSGADLINYVYWERVCRYMGKRWNSQRTNITLG